MISRSRSSGDWALNVFEGFRIDTMLPKHTRVRELAKQAQQGGIIQNAVGDGASSDPFVSMKVQRWGTFNGWADGDSKDLPGWRRKAVRFFERALGVAPARRDDPPSGRIDPLRVLMEAKVSLAEVRNCMDRMAAYDEAIRQAAQGGQTARVEKLMLARKTVQQESVLLAGGFGRFLSEAQAIEFASKCQKGLRLDWAANFVRPFPPDALARKKAADELMVFDNYALLHYDPKAKAFSLTAAQEAAKRDPILFGLIEGVRKLYFVADWKDDECDLTMDEVARVLGHGPGEIGIDPTRE